MGVKSGPSFSFNDPELQGLAEDSEESLLYSIVGNFAVQEEREDSSVSQGVLRRTKNFRCRLSFPMLARPKGEVSFDAPGMTQHPSRL